MNNIQHLLLAAGASKRMGKPKQLLAWGKETLIEHQIHVLLATNNKVSVVLGAYSDKISEVIKKFPIEIYTNKDWENGMGTSISYGLKMLLDKHPNVDALLISLIDQPLIKSTHFKKMTDLFQPGNNEIIVSYSEKGWSGSPVLFDKVYFKELLKLKGDEGAKRIVQKYRNSIKLIDGGDFLKDIDTHQAYLELLDTYIMDKP
ncbi:MAG: nucleotidyltransferase family protein [Aureibaculum sp.]